MNRRYLIEKLKTARYVKEGKPTGERSTRIHGYNMHYDESQWDVAVRYHATNVVTYHANGSITLNSGGWYTLTTATRMNKYLPYPMFVCRRKGAFHLHNTNSGKVYSFTDFTTIPAHEVRA